DGAVKLIAGTAYNAFNAFTEYIDHYSPVSRTRGRANVTEFELRQERALFGYGARMKEKALDIILDATVDAPRRSLPIKIARGGNAALLNEVIEIARGGN